MAGLYTLEVNDQGLNVLLDIARLKLSPAQLGHMGLAVRDMTARTQSRAVRNVSGYPVQFDGKVFRVVPRTGGLKGSVEGEWPYQGVFMGRVYVNGSHTATPIQMGAGIVKPRPVSEYASAIEYGHEAIDLKKTMQGKTVPFFASKSSSSTGPFNVRGLTPVAGAGGALWENKPFNERLAAGGKDPMHFARKRAAAYAGGKKGGGSYYIAFRKVGKTGWIIPEAKARPFMAAAGRGPAAQRDARSMTVQRLREVMQAAANGNSNS